MASWSYKVRKRNLYDPAASKPFRISRSKIDLFLECPRCFYMDRRLGVGRPSGFPFNLNSLVDTLLKREFDQYRISQRPHPLMEQHGLFSAQKGHKRDAKICAGNGGRGECGAESKGCNISVVLTLSATSCRILMAWGSN